MAENSIGAVEKAAMDKNGWDVIGVIQHRRSDGTLPSGVIAFVRREYFPPDRLGRCGTAAYSIHEDGSPFFYWGHYDMRRNDAIADLVARAVEVDQVAAA